MKREGILNHSKSAAVSGNTCDLLGEVTNFRLVVGDMIESLVQDGKWFGFVTRVSKEQEDIFALENSSGESLGNMVKTVLDGVFGDVHRTSLYRYLLHDYLCYYEEPSVMKSSDTQGFKDSYKKYLVTSNVGVVAEWLNIPLVEAKMLYGTKLGGVETASDDDDMYPYVKLTVDKDGTRKVSKPRTPLDLGKKGVRVIPLFALRKGVSELYGIACHDFFNVTFVKDSGQERVINVCFSYDKLKEVYSDLGALEVAFGEQYKGSFMENSTLGRGYIRVIEVGSCLKSHAVRSINFARILKIERAKPDLTFIDVDLTTVKDEFLSGISYKRVNYKEFVDMLDVFNVGQSRNYNGHRLASYADIETWVAQQEVLLSTPFIKQLALFIMGNPQWYMPSDDDIPPESSSSSAGGSNSGDTDLDFGEIDFDNF